MRTKSLSNLFLILLVLLESITSCDGFFGRKKRREAEERRRLAEEAARRAKLVIIFGVEFNKKAFYTVSTILALLVGGIASGLFQKKRRGNRPGNDTIDIVVVGCGMPKKSMGWFHLTQFLEMENVNVRAIVEPFYLDPSISGGPAPAVFSEFVSKMRELGIEVVADVEDLPKFKKPTMCLLAGRTHDNPKFFRQCIKKEATSIYLEKPGATSVKELSAMKVLADTSNVKVFMGYNKNVSPYIEKAVALSKEEKNSEVLFVHSNSYNTQDLPEVFTRNSEGMLKNMVIHELAVIVTFFDVTVESIDKLVVNTNKLFSEKLILWKPGTAMPNPEYISDFSRAAFKITTKKGTSISVMADRCGGNSSFAVVKDENGIEIKKFEFPEDSEIEKITALCKADPEMMPYFFIQADDYQKLKDRIIKALMEGGEADGVAMINVAIEAMRLAEYATDQLESSLKAE